MGIPIIKEIQISDLATYVGETLDGLPHGYGTLTSAKLVYRGDFKDGLPHGNGSVTIMETYMYEGVWVNGIVITESMVCLNDNITL